MGQKRIITEEKGSTLASINTAVVDLKKLIATENPDVSKWKLEDVIAHLKGIERILGTR